MMSTKLCLLYYIYILKVQEHNYRTCYHAFQSGARMSVGDGKLTIVAKNQSVMDKVLEKVLLPFC